MLKKLITLMVLTSFYTSAYALIKNNDAYPSDLASSNAAMPDETLDGNRENARLDTPRNILLSPDKEHLLLFDNNGYGMRLVNRQGTVTTTKVELHRYPKYDLKEYKAGNMLLADSANNTIIQVSPDYTPYLFAGKRLTAAESDAKLMQNITGENNKAMSSSLISEAEFNIPINITAIDGKGWILIDSMFDNILRFIDTKGFITQVKGLESLADAERVTVLRKNKDNLYLLGEQNVYKIAFDPKTKSAKIISQWNNSTVSGALQFHRLTGIAFDDKQIVVADEASGMILELHPDNTTKALYQIPCSSLTYRASICETENPNDDSIFTSYGDIIKNPWDKGFIVSDSGMNVLYKFSDGQLSLFTGQLKDSSYLKHSLK